LSSGSNKTLASTELWSEKLANVVPLLVREDPVHRRDDVARHGHAVVVHVERDEPRAGRAAGVVRRPPGGDSGQERSVLAAVPGRVRLERREIDLGDDAVAEVFPPGVDA
jgi:hypothetical protein